MTAAPASARLRQERPFARAPRRSSAEPQQPQEPHAAACRGRRVGRCGLTIRLHRPFRFCGRRRVVATSRVGSPSIAQIFDRRARRRIVIGDRWRRRDKRILRPARRRCRLHQTCGWRRLLQIVVARHGSQRTLRRRRRWRRPRCVLRRGALRGRFRCRTTHCPPRQRRSGQHYNNDRHDWAAASARGERRAQVGRGAQPAFGFRFLQCFEN